MNPNSISHRLFAAALTQAGQPVVKRAEPRIVSRPVSKAGEVKKTVAASAAQKLSEWSWSGWQHTTI